MFRRAGGGGDILSVFLIPYRKKKVFLRKIEKKFSASRKKRGDKSDDNS